VVTDPESEARSGCADAEVAVTVSDVVEGYEEVVVSGGLDTTEVYDDDEVYSVKTTLLDDVVLPLLMLMFVPAVYALETEDEVMTEYSEVLPVPIAPADTSL